MWENMHFSGIMFCFRINLILNNLLNWILLWMLKNIFGNNVKNCGTIKSIFFQQCFFYDRCRCYLLGEKVRFFEKHSYIYLKRLEIRITCQKKEPSRRRVFLKNVHFFVFLIAMFEIKLNLIPFLMVIFPRM